MPARPRHDPASGRAAHLAALARSPILATLSPRGLERLLDAADVVGAAPGETVVREGTPSGAMYFVLAGELRLRRADLELKPIGPGGHFGALGFLTGQPRTVTVIAGGGVTVARLTPPRWAELVEHHPKVAIALLTALLVNVRGDLVEMTDNVGFLLHGRSLPRAREISVRSGGAVRGFPTGTSLRHVLAAGCGGRVVAALLDQKPVSLNTPLFADAAVEPLTLDDSEGRQVWARSLGLLLLEAARQVAPELPVRMGSSLGRIQLVEAPGAPDLAAFSELLSAAMRRLVDGDAPILQEVWAVEEAQGHFHERGWYDAARLLATWRQATVSMAACGGLYALGMGPFLPSAACLQGWTLARHGQALALDYGKHDPRNGAGGSAAAALAAAGPTVNMLAAHRGWLDTMGVASVGAFNELCISGGVAQLIRAVEGFHEKRIGAIADDIAARREAVRVIVIAGPSSSGKTTFIKRLTTQLLINGLRPVGLSLDDYYVDRERNVRDEHGEYDFEALEAIDLQLLQDHVRRLLAGEAVATARYDFLAGKSRPGAGPQIRLAAGDVLLLEGIHGLNPRLLAGIPEQRELYRVFLQPATTLPFDRLSRVSATDLRLLRRIVRDRHQRGYRAEENILRWPSVQRGERRHIFPFQGEADAVFDSSLVYEPSVLKVYAERYLLEVPRSSPAFATAWRLRLLVDRFVSIYPDHVPPTSILREFIGGSGFEY